MMVPTIEQATEQTTPVVVVVTTAWVAAGGWSHRWRGRGGDSFSRLSSQPGRRYQKERSIHEDYLHLGFTWAQGRGEVAKNLPTTSSRQACAKFSTVYSEPASRYARKTSVCRTHPLCRRPVWPSFNSFS